MDITQLILDDHHEQRRLFAILEEIDPADTGTLEAIWARLSAFLEVHAAAGHQAGTSEWFAAVAAVNMANGDHMAEEEREGLTDFRRRAGLQLRHGLAVAFAAFEARHFAGVPAVDKDPEAYVREAERGLAAGGVTGRPDGSLGIGGLGKEAGKGAH